MANSPFLTSIRDYMQVRHYSKRTIHTYLYWIKGFILFNQKQHPSSLGPDDVERFLTHLAVNRTVSPSTQSIALNALAFMYSKVLNQPIGDISHFRRAKRQQKLPVVLTIEEVQRMLQQLQGPRKLMAALLYGSGLRRIELARLRVKDVDLDHLQVRVWNGKGAKHRLTTLAPELKSMLLNQINRVAELLNDDKSYSDYAGGMDALCASKKVSSRLDGYRLALSIPIFSFKSRSGIWKTATTPCG